MPGGTDSNFRAWGEDTIYVDRGKGGMVWDIDGNEFVDLRMGYGPVILGHGDDRVDDYVNERMRRGVSFSLTSEDEVRAMELVKELTGWVDKARMTVSGTEATMHAMRVARAYTGRDKIVKFEGQYHGVHDYALISVGTRRHVRAGRRGRAGRAWPGAGASRMPSPTRSSRPATTTSSALRTLFEARGEEIAAIIVEPVLGNAQGIMPKPGFHQAMRALTEEFGILLIFDEVKTGFRFAKGGAAEYFGITPGPRDVRQGDGQRLSGRGVRWPRGGHERPARQGQPRRHVRRQPGRRRGRGQDPRDPARHERARDDPRHRPARPGRPARGPQPDRAAVPLHRPPVDVRDHVPEVEASEYRDWATTDHELYDAIAVGMHARGAMPEPDSREPWFICEAHAQGDIVDRVVSIFSDSLDAALEARAHGDGRSRTDTAAMSHPGAG